MGEIEAEPYVHIEPELTPEALGVIVRNQPAAAPVAAPVQFSAPAIQQQFAPQQFAAAPVAAGVWSGACVNHLGQGVACRAQEPQVAAPVVAPRQQFVPQQHAAPAVQARFNGACLNNLGAAVPCSQ